MTETSDMINAMAPKLLQRALPVGITFDYNLNRFRSKNTGRFVSIDTVEKSVITPKSAALLSNNLTLLETQFLRMSAYSKNITTLKKAEAEYLKDTAREGALEDGPDVVPAEVSSNDSTGLLAGIINRVTNAFEQKKETLVESTAKVIVSIIGMVVLAKLLSPDEVKAQETEQPEPRTTTPTQRPGITPEAQKRTTERKDEDSSSADVNLPNGAGSTDNANKAMSYFMSQGWTREQAAGIVGNLQAESSPNLNPAAVGLNDVASGVHSYGIAQWNRERYEALKAFARERGTEWSDFTTQLMFVQKELTGKEKKAGDLLKKATTAEQAAAIIQSKYERSTTESLPKRIANAKALVAPRTNTSSKPPRNMFETMMMMRDVGLDVMKSVSRAGSSTSKAKITSGFGLRTHPITKKKGKMHNGYDLAEVPAGTPVTSLMGGTVVFAGNAGTYGNLVKIKDNATGKIETRYAHLSSLNVTKGQTVSPGDIIGAVGSTGRSTGNHLHFEYRVDGNPVPVPPQMEKALPRLLIPESPKIGAAAPPTQTQLGRSAELSRMAGMTPSSVSSGGGNKKQYSASPAGEYVRYLGAGVVHA